MEKTRTKKIRYYLKWALWVLVVQLVLMNISSAIYAYKFTHFYNEPAPVHSSENIFHKTWKLFVGPKFYKNANEPSPAFPYETVSFKTPDNIIVDGWYSGLDSAKACVIFFHGLSVNKSFLENEAAIFRQWGYNVLLIDFRAHGRSSGNTSTFGMKETAEVQKAFEFAISKGNKKIILYGVSLGAGVCIKAVSQYKLKPIAIIADMPFGTLHNHLRARAAMVGFPPEPFASLVTTWIGIERGYNGFKHNIAGYAKDVKCPALVEWGEKDQLVMRDEVENVYASISSPNKKLVIYPDAGHESFIRNDPNKWKEEVRNFLGRL